MDDGVGVELGSTNPADGDLRAGGADTRFSENIDLANPKDAALANRIAKENPRRWKLPAERKVRFAECALNAAEAAAEACDYVAFAAVGRLIVTMEGQNQTDELDEKKNARLDNDQPTENVTFTVKAPRVIGQ